MNDTSRSGKELLLWASIAAALYGTSAQAAEADTGLAEVVVTAERREQNLQDVPIAASVFSGEDLDRRGVTDLTDVQQVAPSIAINAYNRSTFINIRGVGIAQSAPTSNPGVAFYIDGQLIPHEQFIGQAFYDIGSIEVLRGPQGTLTGQNSTGGAIYVRSPAPRFGQFSASVEQTIGNYDWGRTVGAANLGFTDWFAMRVSAVHDERDSFTSNIGPSRSQPGNANLNAQRVNFAFRALEERLTANLRIEHFDFDSDNNAVKNRNDAVSSDPFVIEEDALSFMDQYGHRVNGEVRFGLSDSIDLRVLSSWQNGTTVDQTDGDRTATALPQPPATNLGRVAFARTDFRTWMHEVNLLSKGDGPLQWVVGGFLMDEDVPVSLLRDNRNTTNFVQSNSTIITKAYNESRSVFGQANWFVTPEWELLGGLRHSSDEQRYNRIALPGPPPPAGTDTVGPAAKSDEVTGKVGVNWHLADEQLAYATASKGYKAGGVNLTLNTPNFLPETNKVYELGYKTTMLDRRLRVNAAVFHSDYQDIQLSSLFNALPLTQNAASGEAWGAELELTGRFGALGFNAGLGWLDAQFAQDALIVNTVTNQLQRVAKGAELPFSPELTANAGVDFEIPLGARGRLVPRVQWSHLGEQLATPFPSVASIVPSRDLVDVRLTYAHDAGWQVEGFVNNATDRTYIAAQIQNSTSATGGIIYGAPRQYGIRIKADFGP
jgi:iron complex outermembrane receptor protein